MNSSEIKFIPNEDFESTCEQDFEDVDIELYAAEDGRNAPVERHEAAATFLQAIEESRILTFDGEQFLFKRLNFLRFRASALQATLKTNRRPGKTQKEIDRLLCGAQDAREDIARANLRLVCSIVRRIASIPDDIDELTGEANAILLNAIDKFDFSRGYRFSTYATHAIQRHLYRFLGQASKKKQREKCVMDSVDAVAPQLGSDDEPTAARSEEHTSELQSLE